MFNWLRNNKNGAWRKYSIDGYDFSFRDMRNSTAAECIVNEVKAGEYALDGIVFSPGDVVVDIGAHIGVVSIYLAKKYPFLKIYSYEPMADNYENLTANIKKNRAENIQPFNMAVTKDGRDFNMIFHESNTGGATGQLGNMELAGHVNFTVKSTTIDRIFNDNGIKKCKLLKIDCEGSEHEILCGCSILDRVENIRGEFHINAKLRQEGYSIEGLVAHCEKFVPGQNIKVVKITMAE
jgi:FkbM family methyltransferase